MKLSLACAKNKDTDLEFWLENTNGGVQLVARKFGGFSFYILTVKDDGTLKRHASIKSTGLSINEKGVIKLANNG